MFIAMNRFKVRKGEVSAFVVRWRERGAGESRSLTISHPEFEGFEIIQLVAPPAAGAAK